jgi:hypothetical protein
MWATLLAGCFVLVLVLVLVLEEWRCKYRKLPSHDRLNSCAWDSSVPGSIEHEHEHEDDYKTSD